MAIEAVKIPQNVYVEDRIIGPVTLRQIIVTGIGAGISYAIYATVTKAGVTNVVTLGACWIPAFIAAMFSFLKINDLSLLNIILLMIESFNKPSKRVWDPSGGLMISIITKASKKNDHTERKKGVSTTSDHLMEMTHDLQEREEQLRMITAYNDINETQELRIQPQANSSLPVNKGRVALSELKAHLSIDGVMTKEHLCNISLRSRFQ